MTRIAFIGLGNMGAPMVKHLANSGQKVQGYDLSASAREVVEAMGVATGNRLDKVVTGADVVISMLSSSEQVRRLYLGSDSVGDIPDRMNKNTPPSNNTNISNNLDTPNNSDTSQSGIFSLLKKGTLIIDCSTIAVEEAQSLARKADELGLDFVDAPVSGSIAGARSARLTFIVGGSDKAFNKAKPILLTMGDTVFHAGKSGAGQAAKICNNMMLGILMSGSAEVLNLGQKNGVDPAVLTDIMVHSSGRNWALEVYNPYPNVLGSVPANKQYTNGFSSCNMYKDLTLALQVAQSSGVQVPLGARATELYEQHVIKYADKDFSSIMVQYDASVLK